jgi:hypothetical protein
MATIRPTSSTHSMQKRDFLYNIYGGIEIVLATTATSLTGHMDGYHSVILVILASQLLGAWYLMDNIFRKS